MASLEQRVPENVSGTFFVDSSCIDCDTCRQIAPEIYGDNGRGNSYVAHQPADEGERLRAGMALVACPTSSIGTTSKVDLKAATRAFPDLITEDIYYCGFAAESSFGASSYLIRRSAPVAGQSPAPPSHAPASPPPVTGQSPAPPGNVLVDSPRAAKLLLDRIETMGGVRQLFLTHQDDVADHAQIHARFGCERILHGEDVGHGTREVERKITGTARVALDDDLICIPVPGHTAGSMALLYRGRFLFTGDHLWANEDGRLGASRSVSWYSWAEQTKSMEALLDLDVEWVLPGHGRRWHAASPGAWRAELTRLVEWMRNRR
jgi:glyoxylase-like metal-dependent hydrolase (beta-lactamase superfamily II)/ferredoxin